ncbi:hypothetical protein SAY87_028021 [Trapa incisa]|uniref:TF-B3 domain-containing protein n=1 Tax=Trapa incisa TaxID=236973 RepID=A0AAN7L1U6_9MYRT|nr:hypothetical protein SAY87_028021 [Trapa incisa]
MASPDIRTSKLPHRNHYVPETPHFLMTIIPELLTLGKLQIPRAFIRKYGKDLPNPVILKVPSGETWTVELVKHGDRVWLGKCWKNFLERFSILKDYSICFKFKGNMFYIFIFDQTGCEIEYPIKSCGCHNMAKCRKEFPGQEDKEAGCDPDYIFFLNNFMSVQRGK